MHFAGTVGREPLLAHGMTNCRHFSSIVTLSIVPVNVNGNL